MSFHQQEVFRVASVIPDGLHQDFIRMLIDCLPEGFFGLDMSSIDQARALNQIRTFPELLTQFRAHRSSAARFLAYIVDDDQPAYNEIMAHRLGQHFFDQSLFTSIISHSSSSTAFGTWADVNNQFGFEPSGVIDDDFIADDAFFGNRTMMVGVGDDEAADFQDDDSRFEFSDFGRFN